MTFHLFDIIWIKIFYIDDIEKVVCAVFYVYILNVITHFYNVFINIKLLLIHFLCSEMVITVLREILSNKSKY